MDKPYLEGFLWEALQRLDKECGEVDGQLSCTIPHIVSVVRVSVVLCDNSFEQKSLLSAKKSMQQACIQLLSLPARYHSWGNIMPGNTARGLHVPLPFQCTMVHHMRRCRHQVAGMQLSSVACWRWLAYLCQPVSSFFSSCARMALLA